MIKKILVPLDGSKPSDNALRALIMKRRFLPIYSVLFEEKPHILLDAKHER